MQGEKLTRRPMERLNGSGTNMIDTDGGLTRWRNRWYNNRLHGALWLEIGETPDDALIRKLPPDSLLGLFMRWLNEPIPTPKRRK